jgi:transcriptional regulator with XRE-family HTH domain
MTQTPPENWYAEGVATLGDRITAAREGAGMTQAQFSRRLGVKLSTVKAWEDDHTEPRANKLQMMAGMLGVSIRWMLTGEGDGPSEFPETESAPDLRAAISELRQIAAEQARLAERLSLGEKRLRKALEAAR